VSDAESIPIAIGTSAQQSYNLKNFIGISMTLDSGKTPKNWYEITGNRDKKLTKDG